jgi:hypothetical protein
MLSVYYVKCHMQVKLSVVMLNVMVPGACTIKHYKSVIYRKMRNFVVSEHLLTWSNTLAWTKKHTNLHYESVMFYSTGPRCGYGTAVK